MPRTHAAAAFHAGHRFAYADAHDRMACVTCDEWVEAQCRCAGDRCAHFPDAPERPSMAALGEPFAVRATEHP